MNTGRGGGEGAMAKGDTITLDVNGEKTAGYLARPDGDGNGAALVIVQEWWGLNEHIKDIARRYADEGYVAFAPDLYGGVVTADPQEASRLMHELAPERGIEILNAAVDWLSTVDRVDEN